MKHTKYECDRNMTRAHPQRTWLDIQKSGMCICDINPEIVTDIERWPVVVGKRRHHLGGRRKTVTISVT